MHLGSVGRVEGINISDLDSDADASVVGKEALVFNYFNREVTGSGHNPAGETKSLRIVSDALGYVSPQTGNMVLLIIIKGFILHIWITT
jgi:hypothetical protein